MLSSRLHNTQHSPSPKSPKVQKTNDTNHNFPMRPQRTGWALRSIYYKQSRDLQFRRRKLQSSKEKNTPKPNTIQIYTSFSSHGMAVWGHLRTRKAMPFTRALIKRVLVFNSGRTEETCNWNTFCGEGSLWCDGQSFPGWQEHHIY